MEIDHDTLDRMIDIACAEVAIEDEFRGSASEHPGYAYWNNPLDFGMLDDRLLPYYLTAERVEIEWAEWNASEMEESANTNLYGVWRVHEDITKFYVGVHVINRWSDNDRTLNSIHFIRLPRKNSVNGYPMALHSIKSVRGLGMRNPSVPRRWPMSEVVRVKLLELQVIYKKNPLWTNCQSFFNALTQFSQDYGVEIDRRIFGP